MSSRRELRVQVNSEGREAGIDHRFVCVEPQRQSGL